MHTVSIGALTFDYSYYYGFGCCLLLKYYRQKKTGTGGAGGLFAAYGTVY